MTTRDLNTQKDSFDPVEEEFHKFLIESSDADDWSGIYKSGWIQYMQDTSRLEKFIKDILSDSSINIQKKHRVLDIGCGFGSFLKALQPHFEEVCGIDIDEQRVKWARKRAVGADVKLDSARKLPWPDEWFDFVVSTDMFEHISYQQQELVAAELMRVLKPSGYGFITVPNRFQILDEHHMIWFGSWLPNSLRKLYVKWVSKRDRYECICERTGKGWKSLFENQKLQVSIKARYMKEKDFLIFLFHLTAIILYVKN
ncbi:MAG: class I SAM-dependent methyltransferase [Phormidium sp.]